MFFRVICLQLWPVNPELEPKRWCICICILCELTCDMSSWLYFEATTNSGQKMKFVFSLLVLQMPRPVPAVSSCVPTASAWPPSTCATVTTTVETAATSSSAPPLWPAGPITSAATPRSACHSCGAATGTLTALTAQTRGRSAAAGTASCSGGQTAPWGSSAAPMASAFAWRGSVTETRTARTSLTSRTVVSSCFLVKFSWCIIYNFSKAALLNLDTENDAVLLNTQHSFYLGYKLVG